MELLESIGEWLLPIVLSSFGIFFLVRPIFKSGENGFGRATINFNHILASIIFFCIAATTAAGEISYMELMHKIDRAQVNNAILSAKNAVLNEANTDLLNLTGELQKNNENLLHYINGTKKIIKIASTDIEEISKPSIVLTFEQNKKLKDLNREIKTALNALDKTSSQLKKQVKLTSKVRAYSKIAPVGFGHSIPPIASAEIVEF
jgi:hypothetical protein